MSQSQMSFSKAFIHQMGWILLLGLLNYIVSNFYPADGYTLSFSWISYIFMAIVASSSLLLAKLIIDLKPKINLTVVVFGMLSFKFLFILFFFGIYFFTKQPEGRFFVIPFMCMFFYFLIIENVYLLKYANYVFETSQRNNP